MAVARRPAALRSGVAEATLEQDAAGGLAVVLAFRDAEALRPLDLEFHEARARFAYPDGTTAWVLDADDGLDTARLGRGLLGVRLTPGQVAEAEAAPLAYSLTLYRDGATWFSVLGRVEVLPPGVAKNGRPSVVLVAEPQDPGISVLVEADARADDLTVGRLSVLRYVALAATDGEEEVPEGSVMRTEAGDLAVVVGGQQHILYHTGNLPGGPPSVYVPAPYVLREADYEWASWPASALPGTYPPSTRLMRGGGQDPTLAAEPDTDYVGPYDLTSGTRIVGLGDQGLAFLNTASQGNLGALVLGLDTMGASAIEVAWLAGTVARGDRPYRLALQYRIGPTGPWALLEAYPASLEAGHAEARVTVLPPSAEGQPYVQLRWKYHAVGTGAGTRPQLRLGRVHVTAER